MKRLVIDTETTGLSADKNQILTIGMSYIDVSKNNLEFLENRHFLLRHNSYNISKMAMTINRINIIEHHKIASPVIEVLNQINNFINDYNLKQTITLGHNFQFDECFLKKTYENHGMKYPFCKDHEDTMYMWRNMKKLGLVNQQQNSRLKTLAEYYKVDYSNAHDALADCIITAKVYHKMI